MAKKASPSTEQPPTDESLSPVDAVETQDAVLEPDETDVAPSEKADAASTVNSPSASEASEPRAREYEVLTPIRYSGDDYAEGAVITLIDSAAQSLIALAAVRPADPK